VSYNCDKLMGLGVDGEEKARRRAWESGFAGFFEIGSVILAVTCEKQRMMGFFFSSFC
jgi:hypothetical protein